MIFLGAEPESISDRGMALSNEAAIETVHFPDDLRNSALDVSEER